MMEGILTKNNWLRFPPKPKKAKLNIMGGDLFWILQTTASSNQPLYNICKCATITSPSLFFILLQGATPLSLIPLPPPIVLVLHSPQTSCPSQIAVKEEELRIKKTRPLFLQYNAFDRSATFASDFILFYIPANMAYNNALNNETYINR